MAWRRLDSVVRIVLRRAEKEAGSPAREQDCPIALDGREEHPERKLNGKEARIGVTRTGPVVDGEVVKHADLIACPYTMHGRVTTKALCWEHRDARAVIVTLLCMEMERHYAALLSNTGVSIRARNSLRASGPVLFHRAMRAAT